MSNKPNLPCLLRKTIGCLIEEGDENNWKTHNLSHFGAQGPPTKSMCIFCDASFQDEVPLQGFTRRMTHIADHFAAGCILDNSRPDFFVIQHLWKKGCINEADYNNALLETERPPCDG